MENIEQLCSFFERRRKLITKLDVDWALLPGSAAEDYQVRFYPKALLVVGIDTLAGVRFPRAHFPDLHRKNRDRFIRFLRVVTQWSDGERVSVPFLLERLVKSGLGNGTLGKHLDKKLANFDVSAGGHLGISQVDEPAAQLLCYATSEKEEVAISDLQHY